MITQCPGEPGERIVAKDTFPGHNPPQTLLTNPVIFCAVDIWMSKRSMHTVRSILACLPACCS
jgi:hypothetical protein